jgi:hypothetical protein
MRVLTGFSKQSFWVIVKLQGLSKRDGIAKDPTNNLIREEQITPKDPNNTKHAHTQKQRGCWKEEHHQ